MRLRQLPTIILAGLALLLLTGRAFPSPSADSKFQVILVWGTDDPAPPPGKNYNPLDAHTRSQVKALKWKNYFEVKRIDFAVAQRATTKVAISEKCEMEVKDLGAPNVEVALFGKGKEVGRFKPVSLPKGQIFVPAGNAPNETAWLLILKRLD
jgi:hypothetical protein